MDSGSPSSSARRSMGSTSLSTVLSSSEKWNPLQLMLRGSASSLMVVYLWERQNA
jgi:hypothetical protein